ncbi:MAG: hypothetical protein AAGU75_23745, partial [Bacillota bacterium]
VIETLRLKTEEIDMDQYLKSKLGGYTKQSVLEYLNILRKQQQTTADTFSRNMQTLYNEKETIKKENETLHLKVDKIESEYKNLSEAITAVQFENSDLTMQDVIALQKKSAALEEELKKSSYEKTSLENEIKHLNDTLNDLSEKLKLSQTEIAAANEVIITEKQEKKELRDKVVGLTIIIEDKQDEVKYLKALQSEGQVAELTSQVSQLTSQLSTQTEVMSNLNALVCNKGKTVETLTDETILHKQMLNDLNKTVEELQQQNEKLLHANTAFSKQLQDNCLKTIDLINEKSDIIIEKIAAERKLDEANSKISMLELKLQRSSKMDDLKGC